MLSTELEIVYIIDAFIKIDNQTYTHKNRL